MCWGAPECQEQWAEDKQAQSHSLQTHWSTEATALGKKSPRFLLARVGQLNVYNITENSRKLERQWSFPELPLGEAVWEMEGSGVRGYTLRGQLQDIVLWVGRHPCVAFVLLRGGCKFEAKNESGGKEAAEVAPPWPFLPAGPFLYLFRVLSLSSR